MNAKQGPGVSLLAQLPMRTPPNLATGHASHGLLTCLAGDAWGARAVAAAGGAHSSPPHPPPWPRAASGGYWTMGAGSGLEGRGPARELGDGQPFTSSGTAALNPCLNY